MARHILNEFRWGSSARISLRAGSHEAIMKILIDAATFRKEQTHSAPKTVWHDAPKYFRYAFAKYAVEDCKQPPALSAP